jgi:3,4-dihydroxy 2-butanone 4-phosphate synthase/GTP cyclohydrolase II
MPDGSPRPLHEFGIGASILADLGLSTIRILTNRTRKLPGLDAFGITITGQVPLQE